MQLLATKIGLLALKMFGVEPEVSLDVINSSSGRSMATQERIPQEVLSGNFNFGFKLSLMAKDCRIAGSILDDTILNATLLPEVIRLINSAESDTLWGKNADYTEVVRVIEENAGHKLRYKNGQ
jgi:3-hydroxyisobutyrate dehydrogenase-like beta-hydroxyacid dehydrogenase